MHDARVQFGCGFLFALLAASWIVLVWFDDVPGLVLLAIVLATAAVVGALCARYGDRAWPTIVDWTDWLR